MPKVSGLRFFRQEAVRSFYKVLRKCGNKSQPSQWTFSGGQTITKLSKRLEVLTNVYPKACWMEILNNFDWFEGINAQDEHLNENLRDFWYT